MSKIGSSSFKNCRQNAWDRALKFTPLPKHNHAEMAADDSAPKLI